MRITTTTDNNPRRQRRTSGFLSRAFGVGGAGTLILIAVLGAGGLLLFAAHYFVSGGADGLPKALSVLSVGLAVAGAAITIGGLLGFIFAVPRLQQGDSVAKQLTESPTLDKATQTKFRVRYLSNTNLEDISDWLTKILVGVGLTQIGQIPEATRQLASVLKPGFGGADGSDTFAIGILIYFLIAGFLQGYIVTRIFFIQNLQEVENKLGGRDDDDSPVHGEAPPADIQQSS